MIDTDEMSLSQLIYLSAELRDKAAEHARQEKAIRAQKAEVDAAILASMENMGVRSTGVDDYTVTATTERIASVEDWNAFYDYIVDTRAPHLMQRRVTQEALRELRAQGEEVPGVTFIEQTSLSLRKR